MKYTGNSRSGLAYPGCPCGMVFKVPTLSTAGLNVEKKPVPGGVVLDLKYLPLARSCACDHEHRAQALVVGGLDVWRNGLTTWNL